VRAGLFGPDGQPIGTGAEVSGQPRLVGHDDLLIGRNDDIQLQHVHAQRQGVQKGGQRVFGPQPPTAPMAVDFGSGRNE